MDSTEPPENPESAEPPENPESAEPPENPEGHSEHQELRIVLFGKIEVGKSTLGDIILGDTKRFTSENRPEDRTEKCQVERTKKGQNVVVVDTPGLFKIGKSEAKLVREIKRSIDLASPGPHVFLLVLRWGEITSEELETLEVFERTFGKRAMAYTMVVFTHDNDEVDEAAMKTEMNTNPRLRELIERCQWRYFVCNIDAQVTELLKKITEMRKEYCYTHEMLQEAEKAAKEEQQEEKTKTEETTDRHAILEMICLLVIAVGIVLGYYLISDPKSTSGPMLGGVYGLILGSLIALLWTVIKWRKKPDCKGYQAVTIKV